MPLFTRRRLQTMLDDLRPRMSAEKAKNVVRRLDGKDTQNAMATEMELGIVWAIGRAADLTIEPELPGAKGKKPDAFSATMFPSGRAVIEAAALSDDTFSGRKNMERAANKILDFLGYHQRDHLYFEFAEQMSYEGGRFRRWRRVTHNFKLTDDLKQKLREAIGGKNRRGRLPSIRLTDDQIDVTIHWQDRVYPTTRVFCTMPPIAYNLEDNPIYRLLSRKQDDLSSVPPDTLKCVILGDAGCGLLRNLGGIGKSPEQKTGAQIIRHFLGRSNNDIDIVCVLTQTRYDSILPMQPDPVWFMRLFDRRFGFDEDDVEHSKLRTLVAALPRPIFEGYQARSLHIQGAFRPQARGWYVATTVSIAKTGQVMSIKTSARLVQQLLAGRITPQQFHSSTFGNDTQNFFDTQLKRGMTIRTVRIEPAGVDEDDDYMVFDLAPDPAAKTLQVPKVESEE
jgi:hypothetical protein